MRLWYFCFLLPSYFLLLDPLPLGLLHTLLGLCLCFRESFLLLRLNQYILHLLQVLHSSVQTRDLLPNPGALHSIILHH
ncbi:hypothetical protein BJ165DRAFT_1457962 [Panaeolus papilionaceus]|nr:hypothetical protein BJ165DRAFT_1457962 [Panaeolus papilionaceus]